jgi:hypothetical protein
MSRGNVEILKDAYLALNGDDLEAFIPIPGQCFTPTSANASRLPATTLLLISPTPAA